MHCPNCKKWITWLQKWRFSTVLGIVRKVSPCPNCGTNLIWEKWPYRIMWIGIGFLYLAALVSHSTKSGSDNPFWMVCIAAAIVLQLTGVFTLKFHVVNKPERKNKT
jgi:hypothetical protein